jgi:DNA invertase Pin-like site-specific DNA recombinase
MMREGRRGRFSVILTAAFDRLARSTRNFLAIIDEAEAANIQIISAREAVDTSTPTGRMFVTMLGCIAEMEKSFIRERIKAGMHRRKLEGLPVGRQPLNIDHDAVVADRLGGMSLTETAKRHGISRASVVRFVREARQRGLSNIEADHQLVECAA